jgi:hypothetical protein
LLKNDLNNILAIANIIKNLSTYFHYSDYYCKQHYFTLCKFSVTKKKKLFNTYFHVNNSVVEIFAWLLEFAKCWNKFLFEINDWTGFWNKSNTSLANYLFKVYSVKQIFSFSCTNNKHFFTTFIKPNNLFLRATQSNEIVILKKH